MIGMALLSPWKFEFAGGAAGGDGGGAAGLL